MQDSYVNQTVLLSGSTSITLSSIADLLSSHLAKPVKMHVVSVDEFVDRHKKADGDYRGSEEFLRLWATTYPALEAGECGRVDPLLEKLLGRNTKPFEESLKESLGNAKGEGALEQYAK
jgi:hypothetical protein